MDLINTGSDPWILEYEACENLNRDILEQINLRNHSDSSSKEYDIVSARIRNRLKQYNVQVDELSKKLKFSGDASSITAEEKERRRQQLEVLQSNLLKLHEQFKARPFNKAGSSKLTEDRAQLLGNKNESKVFADLGTTSWGDVGSSEPIRDYGASEAYGTEKKQLRTIDELKQDQQRLLAEQDEGLESLSKIISKQKQIAVTIDVELNQQNDILDDLSEGIDRVGGRIQRETRMVHTISRKDSTWGYWLVILILLIAILGVTFA